jgi:DNA-directed RNA polymerase specialized sigma24 family protein
VLKLSNYTDEELVAMLDDEHQAKNQAPANAGVRVAEQAFQELYNRYSSMVHAYCMRVLNNTEQSEDIFQETFIRFFQHIQTNRNTTNIPGFLITIARNLCLNFKRDKVTMVSKIPEY